MSYLIYPWMAQLNWILNKNFNYIVSIEFVLIAAPALITLLVIGHKNAAWARLLEGSSSSKPRLSYPWTRSFTMKVNIIFYLLTAWYHGSWGKYLSSMVTKIFTKFATIRWSVRDLELRLGDLNVMPSRIRHCSPSQVSSSWLVPCCNQVCSNDNR